MTKVYCCIGSYYDVPCVEDCPSKTTTQTAAEQAVEDGFRRIDAIAWRAYSKAWPEAMSGWHLPRQPALMGPDDDPMPRHDYNWLTGESAAPKAEHDAWWARQMEHPKLDWGDA